MRQGPTLPLLVALLLSLVVLPGCATHPVAPPSSTATVPTVPSHAPLRSLDWRQADCEAMEWTVPVRSTSLQPYLPDGFQPQAFDGPTGFGAAAWLGFRAVECSSGLGQDKIMRSVQTGMLFTPVIPPAELRDDRFAGMYEFGWDILVAPDSWRSAAAPWGMPLHDGGCLVGPSAQGWTGELAMDRVGTFAMTGRTGGAGQPEAPRDLRMITKGAQGFALWDRTEDNRTTANGAGLWTVTPGSWVAQVLGSTQGAATFHVDDYDLPDAWVHWPGQGMGPIDGSSRTPAGEPPSLREGPPPAAITIK